MTAPPNRISPTGPWPRITLVTPSYNQARFLEHTLRSVLDQNYPNLEYIVIDGGSTDGSVGIIRKYQDRLAYWVSEPDQGHYDAINRGFRRSTGEIMAWLNADDLYLPWTLQLVGEIFAGFQSVSWLTTLLPMTIREDGMPLGGRTLSRLPHRVAFERGEFSSDGHKAGHLMQEGTFWRRSLWEDAGGGMDLNLPLAADYELWARFFQHTHATGISVPLAAWRYHGGNRSVSGSANYRREIDLVLQRYGRPPYSSWGRWWRTYLAPNLVRFPRILSHLNAWFPVDYLKPNASSSGPSWRLARRIEHL